MVKRMVKMGILERCVSQSAGKNVFVEKKGKAGLRCTRNFWGLNGNNIPDKYPVEDPSLHVECLASKRIYTCLDLADAYWQICLAPESRAWAAVQTCLGLFQYTRLAQGLMNWGNISEGHQLNPRR